MQFCLFLSGRRREHQLPHYGRYAMGWKQPERREVILINGFIPSLSPNLSYNPLNYLMPALTPPGKLLALSNTPLTPLILAFTLPISSSASFPTPPATPP